MQEAAGSYLSSGVRGGPHPTAALSGRFNLDEYHCCLVAAIVKNILVPSDRKPNSHCLRKANHCVWGVLYSD